MCYKNSLSDSVYVQELEHEYEYKHERVREHETYKVREQEHSWTGTYVNSTYANRCTLKLIDGHVHRVHRVLALYAFWYLAQ